MDKLVVVLYINYFQIVIIMIFELAISPMHILGIEFYYRSKWIMIVICPAIQHVVPGNIFFSITLTVVMPWSLLNSSV